MSAVHEPTPQLPHASEIARDCRLGDEARALLMADPTAVAYVEGLCVRGLHRDATVFLAYALTPHDPQRAIWWGCLCAWWVYRRTKPSAIERAALKATVRWILRPTEERRRAAETAGTLADLSNVAGCLAMAAFWTGENMAPVRSSPLPPPYDLAARTLAGALQLAAAQADEVGLPRAYQKFVKLAVEIDKGRMGWRSA
jgi:hypothetical protein